ncbi:hypothetical protein EUX98_g7941 [Antrodiella citrinella]|uniref:UBC core domain-containing protein n=1 Tax=Antrodiella citrinella TaxID=2447956 RepID=A0A4S4MEC2_9APHY|nr:hypothetical protein EUX98_g7941 [Antrodiella citrinella]
MPRKRSATVTKPSPEPPQKRSKQVDPAARDDVNELLEEDEPLESVLARIKQQEDSEAFALKLDAELNGGAGPSHFGTPIFLDEDDDQEIFAFNGGGEDEDDDEDAIAYNYGYEDEDDVFETYDEEDEIFAKQNAQEWANEHSVGSNEDVFEDAMEIDDPPLPLTPPPVSRCKDKGKKKQDVEPAPLPERSLPSPVAEIGTPSPEQQDLLQYRNLFRCIRKCTKCGEDIVSPRGFVRAIALFEALGGFDRIYLGDQMNSEKRAKEAAAKRRTEVGSVGPGGTGYGGGGRGGGMPLGSSYAWGDDSSDDEWGTAEHPLYSYSSRGRGRGNGNGNRGRGGGGGQPSSTTSSARVTAAHWDEVIVRAMSTITMILPAPNSDNAQTYDMIPHSSISSLLLMSKLPELLGTLLRNDSITDWTARSDVYSAMLALLKRFADHEYTMQILIGQRWEMKKSCGLEEWIWDDGDITYQSEGSPPKPVIATPLYRHFKKVTQQCEAFMTGASQMLGDEDGGEETEKIVQSTSLCGDMLATRADIERAMTVMGKDPEAIANGTPEPPADAEAEDGSASTSSQNGTAANGKGKAKGKGRPPDVDVDRAYRQRCEQLAFSHVDIPNTTLAQHYHYATQVTASANATRNPKDRLHLIKELAVMATSLPPGIWVRVDETRNDVIKVMIAGPEGTPYSDGLFEFDCFLPIEYPHKPPLMNLRTTGGGRVRFNPNLYNCGKVCLSLLGTWAGRPEEMWFPGKSTLLQVFVSIQSMILIDLPYFNEPGFGQANAANPQSQSYNKNVCLQTMRWAIVDWLKDEHKDGIWGDVIAFHFTILENKIRARYVFDPPSLSLSSAHPTNLTPPSLRIQVSAKQDRTFHAYTTAPTYASASNFDQHMLMHFSHTMIEGMAGMGRGARGRGKAVQVEGGIDLVAMWEEGVTRVRAWEQPEDSLEVGV